MCNVYGYVEEGGGDVTGNFTLNDFAYWVGFPPKFTQLLVNLNPYFTNEERVSIQIRNPKMVHTKTKIVSSMA